MKSVKIFECSCANGFTGDFCEFKTEQNELLYVGFGAFSLSDGFSFNGIVVNEEGKLKRDSIPIDNRVFAIGSCFTMLNGEAVIFGGTFWQVNNQTVHFSKHSFIF